MGIPKTWWKIPFSLVAGFSFASVGAHILERTKETDDEWAQAAFWMMITSLGILTVVEARQVWRHAGLA